MGSSCWSNNTKQKSSSSKPEVDIPENPLQRIDPAIAKVEKSLCKIIFTPKLLGSGFLIHLFKIDQPFYCLMTNEHVVTKKMIEEKKTIDIYYNI